MISERGFSLIEVIVAVAITSMMIAGFYEIFGSGYRSLAHLQNRKQSLELARSHLEQLGVTTPLVPGKSAGNLDKQTRWQVTVRALANADDAKSRAFHIDYRVIDRNGKPILELQTVKLWQPR